MRLSLSISVLRHFVSWTMKTAVDSAVYLLLISCFAEMIFAAQPISSCDGISNDTRSQICLSGQCPLDCDHSNSSEYTSCDQVCVVQPCAALSCNSSNCLQRCLSGGCNSLMCYSEDCTQTCLGNCTEVNCSVKGKCNQQCEKGHCGLRADGVGVVEQSCAENCNDVKCNAGKCRQTCAGEGCGLECSKGMSSFSITELTLCIKQKLTKDSKRAKYSSIFHINSLGTSEAVRQRSRHRP